MTSPVDPSEPETVSITVELPKQALELLGLTTDEASAYLKMLARNPQITAAFGLPTASW
jgi:hypothetical protein